MVADEIDEKITVEIDGASYGLSRGKSLQDLADKPDVAIVFGCFSGRCGFCRVKIVEGLEHLGPRNDLEAMVLNPIQAPMDERLACQCQPTGFIAVVTNVQA